MQLRHVIFLLDLIIAYLLKPLVLLFRVFNHCNCYLFCERGFDAQDNAYHLYKYFKKQNLKCKFIIRKGSPNVSNLDINDVVYFGSIKHFFYCEYCDVVISTHIGKYMIGDVNPETKTKLYRYKHKFVFLQHGITKDNLVSLYAENCKVDLFICGAEPEYRFISSTFGYPNNVVVYTGFARYDALFSHRVSEFRSVHTILIMPTWRMWLYDVDDFVTTDFYLAYEKLLTDFRILDFCRENNISIVFYPHIELQKYSSDLKKLSNDVIHFMNLSDNVSVQKLLIDADLLITDFSSVFFDFAYMNKPVIYYQFDEEQFFMTHYNKGYFDYRTDGFGPVCDNVEDVVSNVINIVKYGLNDKYITSRNKFFKYQDNRNCERITELILGLNEK